MVHGMFMRVLFVSGLFQPGLTALIEAPRTVFAAAGDEACLKCQLLQSKDVLQVTWQKMSPEGEKNLASFNRYFGERVNAGFERKVAFEDAGLQNCSISIREVTKEDEGCYRCLFNTYPDGALTATTCLLLYELHEPVLRVEVNSPEEAAVSCSATGRPTPTVTLTAPHYNSSSAANANGTVTVTVTAVLPRLQDESTVGCSARVLSGPQVERRATIPEVKQSSADGFYRKTRSNNRNHNFIVLSVICACVLLVLAFLTWFIRKHRNRHNTSSHEDTKKNKTPQKTNKNTDAPRTPLLGGSGLNVLRERPSTGKKESSRAEESSPTSGCPRQLDFTK